MAKNAESAHRWKLSLAPRTVSLLEDLAAELGWSWGIDSKYPRSYPINTQHVFSEMRRDLSEPRPRIKKIKLRPSPPPKRFSDLFDEGLIKTVYEQQHDSSYEAALRLAGTGREGSSKAFHNLMKAARVGYEITFYGDQVIPRPKIHFLHRELLDIAADLGLDELTNAGLEEFFEDVCPCSKTHHAEAIRKLRKRKSARRSS